MTRTLPIVLASTLAVGGGFTLAVNLLLGGTVREASPRVAPPNQPTSSIDEPADGESSYPPEAGNPRLWRSPESTDRRDRRGRRKNEDRSTRRRTSGAAPGATPQPAASAPDPTVSNQGSSPSPSTPAAPSPARSEPAPAKPQPKRGGEDFYSTG